VGVEWLIAQVGQEPGMIGEVCVQSLVVVATVIEKNSV
jgi:hypothetical protein